MKQLIIKLSLISALLLGLLGGFCLPPTAFAAGQLDANQSAICDAIGSGASCDSGKGTSVNNVIAAVINILSSVVAVLAVIMIIVAGFKYITASGDSSKITSAKHTLIYAIVGLAIAALAQTIVKFVLSKVT